MSIVEGEVKSKTKVGYVGLGNSATNERRSPAKATKSFYNGPPPRPHPSRALGSVLVLALFFGVPPLELSAALWHFMQDNQVIADGFTMTQNYIIKDISAVASKLCPVVARLGLE